MSSQHLDVGLGAWSYANRFSAPQCARQEIVDRVEQYVVERALESHPYFELAKKSPEALMIWLSQELVMTNTFSQIVLYAASKIENVHVRAALASVAYGEHNRLRKGRAPGAHPVLLDQLRDSVGLRVAYVRPYAPTIEFVRGLRDAAERPLVAVAAIGVGNERLIIPEYQAVWTCFERLFPNSLFTPFLKANIEEDEVHADLCCTAALQLIQSESDEAEYETAAIASVEARWKYFDGLEAIARDAQ